MNLALSQAAPQSSGESGEDTRAADFGWYVVQLRPNGHAIAERNLRRQDFAVFAPFETITKRRRGGHFLTTRRLLFPGYIFVGFSAFGASWRTINSTYGVARLVSNARDEAPAQVPAGLIEALRARCNDAQELVVHAVPASGDTVTISRGPFVDFVGLVESLAPQQRVWVLLEILGQQTRVAIPAADLRGQPDS